jgi:hypothetical protein
LIRGKHNIFRGREAVSILCFFLKLRSSHKIGGSSEVGDELIQRNAGPGVFEQARRIEFSSPDAAAFVGIDGCYGAIKGGKFGGSRLAINLVLRQGEEMSNTDPGIILKSQLFRLSAI